MSSPAMPLARRTAEGIVVDERLVRVTCRWSDLATRDGERCDLDWSGQAGCVDTAADRQLLAERLLTGPTLAPVAIERLLADEVRPTIARLIATLDAGPLLDGSRDDELRAAIESDARRVGFAAGVRVAGPFHLSIESPSVRRAQEAARARRNLAALALDDAGRTAAMDAVARSLADGCDPAQLKQAAARVGPLDLLRAVGTADPRWSSPQPTLWIAAGDRLVGVDPTRPDLNRAPIAVAGVGPLRSVRGATIDGRPYLLVGGRDGVVLLDPDRGDVRTFRHTGGGDFGFNAVCYLPASRSVLATHSGHGLLRWQLDEPDRPADAIDLGDAARGGRAVLAVDDALAVLLDGAGRLLRVHADARVAVPIVVDGATVVDVAPLDDRRVAIATADRHVAILYPHDPTGGITARYRVVADVAGLAAFDLCGVPRAIVAGDNGSLTMADPDSGAATPLASRAAVRAIRTRPGFVAMLSLDRMRVSILDLSRPDAPPAELHVAATFDKRAADVAFA